MTAAPTTLEALPPETFPVITSHLPLHATPGSVLSLGLVNRRISEIVLPLIHSCIVLEGESDALRMIQRLLAEPTFGLAVRELHIRSELSRETRNGDIFPFNVVSGLQDVIEAGLLPYIHTLDVELLGGWDADEDGQATRHYAKLRPGFCDTLRNKCPRLTRLILRNIGDEADDHWLDESGLYELNLNLSTFSFDCPEYSAPDGLHRMFKNLASISHSLDTLRISQDFAWPDASEIFTLDFPVLRSLSLNHYVVNDTAEAMKFWRRHSSLEFIECTLSLGCDAYFFSDEFSPDFLPNLRHLQAEFPDVLVLAPILHRLISLAALYSVNAQIPYLLRSVLPGGLPKLKSLLINPDATSVSLYLIKPGTRWYETEDGQFGQYDDKNAGKGIFDGYMRSIVRGAPNLEELAIKGPGNVFEELWQFEKLGPSLAPLTRLRRIYFEGWPTKPASEKDRDFMLRGSRIFAEECKSLEVVTDTGSERRELFLNAKIRRSHSGEVEQIDIGTGVGMQIGNEDVVHPV